MSNEIDFCRVHFFPYLKGQKTEFAKILDGMGVRKYNINAVTL